MRHLLWGAALILGSCGSAATDAGREQRKSAGDSLSTLAQQELMQQVVQAMQQGGPEYALKFCAEQALPLTAALAARYQVSVQRLSDRNRNPVNAIHSEADRQVFEAFRQSESLKDTLLAEDGQYYYYKRINLLMPTCLQCHGQPTADIAPATLMTLQELYPDDRATGYHLGDLRGMWKIGFQQ